MQFAKKNQTTKLYTDSTLEEKLKIDFKGWGKQNKFCLKANWIDITHARNVVSARLWADVVRSRDDFEELPELLRTSPNVGAVDGFPVKVYAGGVYQGRYTLNIPKDKWMANMDDDLDTHCILCGENYESGCFRAEAKIDESDWSDEIHDVVPESIKTRWNEIISFVMNSTDEEFAANLHNYFDVTSLIDYYLFGLAICNLDGFGKNQLYFTYDGLKWYASAYDMDSTWGLHCNYKRFVEPTFARSEYEDMINGRSGNLLYMRLVQLFESDIVARWEVLRKGALSISNIDERFEQFIGIAPESLVKEDYAETTGGGKFTAELPEYTDENNIQQIRAYALARLKYINTFVLGNTGETNLWDISSRTLGNSFVVPANGDAFNMEYDKYYNGATRVGHVGIGNNAVDVQISGDDVTLSMVEGRASYYGIVVPIKLEPGENYKLTFNQTGIGFMSVLYYDADKLYQKTHELSVSGDTNGLREFTFTAQNYEYSSIHLCVFDKDGVTSVTYSDIVLEKI